MNKFCSYELKSKETGPVGAAPGSRVPSSMDSGPASPSLVVLMVTQEASPCAGITPGTSPDSWPPVELCPTEVTRGANVTRASETLASHMILEQVSVTDG